MFKKGDRVKVIRNRFGSLKVKTINVKLAFGDIIDVFKVDVRFFKSQKLNAIYYRSANGSGFGTIPVEDVELHKSYSDSAIKKNSIVEIISNRFNSLGRRVIVEEILFKNIASTSNGLLWSNRVGSEEHLCIRYSYDGVHFYIPIVDVNLIFDRCQCNDYQLKSTGCICGRIVG